MSQHTFHTIYCAYAAPNNTGSKNPHNKQSKNRDNNTGGAPIDQTCANSKKHLTISDRTKPNITQAEAAPLTNAIANSPLFKLPFELRELIYLHALLAPSPIYTTKLSGIPEQALLTASKLVRFETRNIFYFGNQHVSDISHFDHAAFVLVRRKVDPKIGGPCCLDEAC